MSVTKLVTQGGYNPHELVVAINNRLLEKATDIAAKNGGEFKENPRRYDYLAGQVQGLILAQNVIKEMFKQGGKS